jgi:hypothetical protein
MPESAAAERLCGVMAAYGGDHRMVVDRRL